MSYRVALLNAAKRIVTIRQSVHGKPEDSFGRIAGLWSAYSGHEIAPAQVPLMLGLLKVARLAESPSHIDNYTDLAGYAACGADLALQNYARKNLVTEGETLEAFFPDLMDTQDLST